MALTTKQRAFVEAYLANGFNAIEAARTAGYQGSYSTLGVTGHDNLKNPKIKAAIDARMKAAAMSADEALLRLSQQAAATMEDFIGDDGRTIDINRVRQRGKMHLIKEFTYVRNADGSERIQIKLHDAQAALNDILKEQHLRAGEPTERNEIIDNLTDEERAARITEILDRARTRRTRSPADKE